MKVSDELIKELRRTILGMLLLLCLPFIVGAVVEHLNNHFTHFNAKRTALMEQIFDIKVDDSVKLIRYDNDSILAAIHERLELETDDYERFMSENVNAELELDESCKGRDFLLYKYKYKSKNVSKQLRVESLENGKYLMTLTYWD